MLPWGLLWFCNLLSRSFRPIPLLIGKGCRSAYPGSSRWRRRASPEVRISNLCLSSTKGAQHCHTRADLSKPELAWNFFDLKIFRWFKPNPLPYPFFFFGFLIYLDRLEESMCWGSTQPLKVLKRWEFMRSCGSGTPQLVSRFSRDHLGWLKPHN